MDSARSMISHPLYQISFKDLFDSGDGNGGGLDGDGNIWGLGAEEGTLIWMGGCMLRSNINLMFVICNLLQSVFVIFLDMAAQ